MRLFILHIILLLSLKSWATGDLPNVTKESIFDQLKNEDIVNVTLELNMDELTEDRRSETKFRSFLTFKDKTGTTQKWNTKIKIRGKFRRMKCNGIPPLKIYFEKEDLEHAGLSTFNDYKIVNFCHDDEVIAKELVIKEYLTYRLYNEITPESFRVQLLKITYKDSNSRKKKKQWAILIEDTAEARARIAAEKPKKGFILQEKNFNVEQIQTMTLFQYMIGNTDFSIRFEKNCKFMIKGGQLIMIPYDFDFSGIVDAPYAAPNSNYGLSSLQERLFMGLENELYATKPVIKLFYQKKENLLEVIHSNKKLSKETREEMISYLESFYENLSLKTLIQSTPEARAKLNTVPVKQ